MKVSAKMNSFYAVMNEKMLVATRPGATSGNSTRQNCGRAGAVDPGGLLQLPGIVATKVRSIQMAIGSAWRRRRG